jgi:hypothetical protein
MRAARSMSRQLPDGSLIVSDDYAGALYRITYDVN